MLKIDKKRLYYITRDVERAMAGLFLDIPDFYIITNDSPLTRELVKKHKNKIIILRYPNNKILDTLELLKHQDTQKLIKKGDKILVFKNTPQIEKYCGEQNWKLLNPSAELANQVEEKIPQIKWLGPLAKYLPKYKIEICKNIFWSGQKFILQFNRSHTGSGTALITSRKQLEEIKIKFPNREARLAEYISGPLFTNNNIVWGDKILLGNISYQITGLRPFTDLPFATIGNDWALPHKILTTAQIKQYKKIATVVGQRLAKQGWKGLFGIDVVMNEKTGQLYLLEINARQPASATFESELQQRNKKKGIRNKTTFAIHLSALLDIPYQNQKLIPITTGAQIIQRVLSGCHPDRNGGIPLTKNKKYKIIKYNNTKPGSDLRRYQFTEGIMEKHNHLKIL